MNNILSVTDNNSNDVILVINLLNDSVYFSSQYGKNQSEDNENNSSLGNDLYIIEEEDKILGTT